MNGNAEQTVTAKRKVLDTLAFCVKFLPALCLAVLFAITLSKVSFNLQGADNTHTVYLVIMILMLGTSIILPLLQDTIVTKIFGLLQLGAIPYACFFLLEYYTHNPFKDNPVMDQNILYLNVAFFYLLALFLTVATTRTDVALSVTALIPMLFGLANFMAMEFRNAPIFPWDLLSFGTAMSVLDNYAIELTPRFFFILYAFTFMVTTPFLCGHRFKLKKPWMNLCTALVAFGIFFGYCSYLTTDECESRNGFYPYLFSANYLYKHNGCVVSFISNTKYLKLEEPAGYDPDNLKALYENYREKAEATVKGDAVIPNIIVIMNEAFSDPAVLGDFETNMPYMPFISSLTENTAKGSVYVSVKGGNTPNSEFEFLTGTSMAFLPAGSIPYQQHISGNTKSLVSQMNDLGYYTLAMHPYPASGWERDEVYPWLGFDRSMFSSDFFDGIHIRSYISDKSVFRKIIASHNALNMEDLSKGTDTPFFAFAVTMQNHGSYSKHYSNFNPDVRMEGNNSFILSSYLSLMKKTDAAFEELINYYRDFDEPTVILMFGDHQPNDNVIKPILDKNGIDMSTASLEVQQTRYQTPYILWANYDLPGLADMPEVTSLNYLAAQVLALTDVPLTPQQCYLLDLAKEFPLMNANCYYNAQGEIHSVLSLADEKRLNLYAQIQYNLVFDRKHLVDEFFDVTSPAR